MDPNETLRQIRRKIKKILTDESMETDDFDALELAELVASLDNWLKSGGFYPKEWTNV